MKICKGSGATDKVICTTSSICPLQGEPHEHYTLCGFVLQVAYGTKKESEKKGQKIKMGKILEAFANDEICVDEVKKQSSKYHELCGQVCDLIDELEEKLDDEGQELLSRLLDAISDENSCYAREKFIRGYSLGVLMLMEVLSEQDTLFRKGGLK